MCTVSVVPIGDGFRLACNRDERRSRRQALAPRAYRTGHRRAVWPLDPEGGGTWIGANDAGLAVAVLNRTSVLPAERPADSVSRGLLVPRLLATSTVDAAAADLRSAVGELGLAPFTLVAIQRNRVVVASFDRCGFHVEARMLDQPMMFTSSSLGDDVVAAPRRMLFDRLVVASAAPLEGQALFHRHRWDAYPHVSVCMARPDAATVSRTVVTVANRQVQLRYRPMPT